MGKMGHLRATEGGYRVWWDIGPDPVTGKRRRRTKTLPTLHAAQTYLTEREAEVAAGVAADVAPERLTVAQLVNTYLEARKIDLRASSWESARSTLHTHVIPHLGKQKVARLTSATVSVFYARLLEAGVSPAMVQKVHKRFHTMCSYAVRWKYLTENPCADAIVPTYTPPDPQTWTPEQVGAFLEHIRGHPLEPAFLLVAVTGMRRSDVCGLQWADITNDEIRIRRGVTEVGTRLIVDEPKTPRSRRTIIIDEPVIRFLQAVRLEQKKNRLRYGEAWQDGDWVVCDELGALVRPGRLTKTFKRIIRDMGLPAIRLHDLRHSWGTNAVAAGVDPKTVADNLGHASVRFTLDVYTHRVEAQHRSAAKRITGMYGLGGTKSY